MKSLIYLFNFVVLIFITSSIDLDSIENRILIQPKKFSKGNNKIEINDCDVQFINRNFKKDCVFDKIIENFNLDYNKINRSSNSTNSNNSCIITIETAVLNCQIVKFNPSSRDWSNYEYFKLEIKENYNVIINANYLNGLIYGLETFLQAIVFPNTYEHNLPNENIYLQELPILIEDYPDYYYRGFMLDVSRHFFSIKCLMQIIDGLVASKINVFHLHLTDDDSFPYESILNNNKITNYNIYSKEDIKILVDYALLRGVTLIPEVDIPGHVRSWDKQISEKFVINKNDNAVLDLSKEAAFKYPIEIIKNIIQDFKLDNNGIIHLGGDEVNYNLWNNTDILKFMSSNNLKTFDDLFNYFLITIRNNLPDMYYAYWIEKQEEFNKFSYFSNKDDNQLLYFWGSYKTLKNVITDKKIIITSGDYLYLDCGMSNTRGDITWCEPYKTWKRIFSIDLNLSSLNIIGYQTSLFSELNDENIVSYKIFPRVSALSYRLWNKQIEYNTEQVQKLYVKLIYFNRNLRRRGFEVQHITSGICEREIDICLSKIKA